MKRVFEVKRLRDGRAMLNLACGSRMHAGWNNVDFSPLAYFATKPLFAKLALRAGILSRNRFDRLRLYDRDILRWNLLKGIPFEDSSFDVVYHSHFLEHLDREAAQVLLRECYRVLKPSGIVRIVVPDLEILCRAYVRTIEALGESGPVYPSQMKQHEESVWNLFAQMVTREPAGTAAQPGLVRFVERLFRGDASHAGETHRWMYDRYTLKGLLQRTGFRDILAETPTKGRIEGWSEFYLDTNADGTTYKADSIYVEGVK